MKCSEPNRKGGENMAISQVQLSTRISYETALRLDHMSKETGQSKAGIVEAALKAYLDAQKQNS
jgi:predicted DNA-binding protein